MTEDIRALIFIFILVSGPIFLFNHFAHAHNLKRDVKTWTIVWCATTILAFLSPNFWIYAAFLAIGLSYISQADAIKRICLFFVLLPSLPAATIAIPGFGLINYVFNIGHHHILSLVLLLPLAIRKSKGINATKFVAYVLLTYFLIKVAIILRDQNITVLLRRATVMTITILIPFFAIRKSVKTLDDFKKILLAIAFGVMIQAVIGAAESFKGWRLYNAATSTLGLDWGYGSYIARLNILRASAALGHPIVLGYVCVIGIGAMLLMKTTRISMNRFYWLFLGIMSVGLVATLSRGPWVGAVLLVIAFIFTGQKAANKLMKLGFAGFLALIIMSQFSIGRGLIDIIPFVNSDEENHAVSTISYRQQLMEQSWIVIKRNPILGSDNYLSTPEMRSMMQGEGIIDIVNSYVGVALESGLVGLGLFLLFFIIPLLKMYNFLPTLKKHNEFKEWSDLNRVFIATILGIMLTIFTTSSIGVVAIYYWSVVGLACAHINAVRGEIFQFYMTKDKDVTPKQNPAYT